MKKGDIALVRFPFTDLTSEKLRPALVLVPENLEGDVVLAFITTQIEKELQNDVFIGQSDLQGTGLKEESLIKLNKLATLNKKIVIGKIGMLTASKILDVNKRLKMLLQL